MASKYRPPCVDANLDNNAHAYALRMIGRDKRVLELGAASGDVTRALTARGCEVTVVEVDESLRADLEEVAERTIIGDLNNPDTLSQVEGTFDAVLCGDVLEHLLHPDEVLTRVGLMLRPDGQVVVSLPNVAHIDVRMALLEGRFEYHPTGLLDNTHIRFFTSKTIDQLVDDAGLVITTMNTVRIPAFTTEIGARRDVVPDTIVAEILRRDPDAETYQFVFSAARADSHQAGPGLAAKYAAARRALGESQLDLLRLESELAALRNSRTMRYTAPLRGCIRALRRALRRER